MSKDIDSEVRAWRRETLKPFSEAALHFGIPFSEARRIYTQDARDFNAYMLGVNTDDVKRCATCGRQVEDPRYIRCKHCLELDRERHRKARAKKGQISND